MSQPNKNLASVCLSQGTRIRSIYVGHNLSPLCVLFGTPFLQLSLLLILLNVLGSK